MDAFWTVWNPDRGIPQFRHPSQESATKEAERLARQQSDESFYVMQAVSVSRRTTVVTEPLFPDSSESIW